MAKWLYLGIVLVGLTIVAIRIARKTKLQATIDVTSVENEIRQSLPPGTPRTVVDAYLERKGIEHRYLDELKDSPDYGNAEIAVIRNASHNWPVVVRRDIQILFKFDDHWKLKSSAVTETLKGL
ncbi:MAG: hypothetical protein LAO55_17490 [Acidobacteriia bacterium]|nr:hypothetical protein [Terriglobia bacterium]